MIFFSIFRFSFNQKATDAPEDYNIFLQRFNQEKDFLPNWRRRKHCLAHLFTYRDFRKGVVGLAYIGAGREYGICNEQNVAFSSYYNSARDIRLFTKEANLVTTHEIAHNFGARHDSDFNVQRCVPGADSVQGNYLMFDLAVSGDKPNNVRLSSCSVSSISKVLCKKRTACFIQQNQTRCLNGIIDDTEDCDPGLFSSDDDRCCDKNCKLKKPAQCSDFNHICCVNCMFTSASNRTVCQRENTQTCKQAIYCNGTSGRCPSESKLLTNNSKCDFDKGRCTVSGCVSVCKYKGMDDCECSTIGKDNCLICCQNHDTGKCEHVDRKSDGSPCTVDGTLGTCVGDVCTKRRGKVPVFEDFTFSKFGRFLKENIVGTIIIFSIMFWAPVACLVHYLDKRQDEEEMMFSHWSHPSNSELVLNMSNSRVRVRRSMGGKDNGVSGAGRRKLRRLFRKEAGSAKRVSGGRFHISA